MRAILRVQWERPGPVVELPIHTENLSALEVFSRADLARSLGAAWAAVVLA